MKANKSLIINIFDKSNRFTLVGWVIVFTLSFYFIYSNAFRYFNFSDLAIYTDDFKPFTPFIIIHILGGMIALVIGPFQFFAVIRNKYKRFHRTTGKIFLLIVLISGVASIYLTIFDSLLRSKPVGSLSRQIRRGNPER